MRFSAATKLTAVIGDPVTHSMSPVLHNALYEREKIDAVMLAFGNPDVAALVGAIRALPIHLAAVTMPHKQTIMPLLDELDKTARAIGAVNTVVNVGGKLTGYNTDVVGIASAIQGVALKGARVLLIGAGGAGTTVAYHMQKSGATWYCTNRDEPQAKALCERFGGTFVQIGDVEKIEYDVVINATPIGMNPLPDASPAPDSIIRKGMAVFDLVYSPLETKLLKRAKAVGATPISGLAMFLAQGLEQERIWLRREFESSWYNSLLEEHVKSR